MGKALELKRCRCGSTLQKADVHPMCLMCLGSSHKPSSCRFCLQMTAVSIKAKIRKLKMAMHKSTASHGDQRNSYPNCHQLTKSESECKGEFNVSRLIRELHRRQTSMEPFYDDSLTPSASEQPPVFRHLPGSRMQKVPQGQARKPDCPGPPQTENSGSKRTTCNAFRPMELNAQVQCENESVGVETTDHSPPLKSDFLHVDLVNNKEVTKLKTLTPRVVLSKRNYRCNFTNKQNILITEFVVAHAEQLFGQQRENGPVSRRLWMNLTSQVNAIDANSSKTWKQIKQRAFRIRSHVLAKREALTKKKNQQSMSPLNDNEKIILSVTDTASFNDYVNKGNKTRENTSNKSLQPVIGYRSQSGFRKKNIPHQSPSIHSTESLEDTLDSNGVEQEVVQTPDVCRSDQQKVLENILNCCQMMCDAIYKLDTKFGHLEESVSALYREHQQFMENHKAMLVQKDNSIERTLGPGKSHQATNRSSETQETPVLLEVSAREDSLKMPQLECEYSVSCNQKDQCTSPPKLTPATRTCSSPPLLEPQGRQGPLVHQIITSYFKEHPLPKVNGDPQESHPIKERITVKTIVSTDKKVSSSVMSNLSTGNNLSTDEKLLGNPKRNVIISSSALLNASKSKTPQDAAQLLLEALFSKETLASRTVTGDTSQGLLQLDPNKIAAIREWLEDNFPSFNLSLLGKDWIGCISVMNSITRQKREKRMKMLNTFSNDGGEQDSQICVVLESD
ncbi:uncharacterized protein LOC120523596 isoform X1 [Polypterus senegalus]|uniref:uncharacterized protein LOC120523596 isoform X1 n=1 Tax=Polypterus senegalus TaxID=55291 RepID=UPI0019639A73|nr:uncharacterized protein LOC120523596 isoform X1 [Polypterus senegalus]